MLPAVHAGLKWLGLISRRYRDHPRFVVITIRRAGNPVADIERALAAGEFVPYYQPIVDIRSGQLRGAEVLVRWKKPDGTLVLPGAFIPLAESSGLIRAMTYDLMRRVCIEAGPAIGRRPALKISFNFGQLFGDESIVRTCKIFSGSPIKLSQVVLERLSSRRELHRDLAGHRRSAGAGVRIATTTCLPQRTVYAARRRHHQDRQDVRRRHRHRPQLHHHLETLVDLAHNMRMDVVAEGVEN